MQVIRHYTNVAPEARGAVVTLGNFDGVHRGHQAVVARTAALADEMGVPLGVMIFEPHPREYFRPNTPPFQVTSFHAKARLLERLGVDFLFVIAFDAALASKTPQEFVMDVLVNGLGVSHIVVGYDFAFGKGRAGDVGVLGWMGAMEGFGLTVVEPIVRPGEGGESGKVFSSTLIRERIRAGNMRGAADILGHWWAVEGHVRRGDQRGRTIGFPTLNVGLGRLITPAHGVYAVWVEIAQAGSDPDGTSRAPLVLPGVANVGLRPTFDKNELLLEIHLLNFSGDLYGRQIRCSFIDFIRPERKFDGLESLKTQIAQDAARAREILAEPTARLDAFAEGLDAITGPSKARE